MRVFDIENIAFQVLSYPLSYVELIGTSFGLVPVYLATRKKLATWFTGIISIVCFFAIFMQIGLYSDMLLQVFFLIASVYGWINWSKFENESVAIKVLSKRDVLKILVLLALITIVLGILMNNIHELFPNLVRQKASFPFMDSFTTVASVIATILMAKRFVECWVFWISVDIISIWLYAQKNVIFISIEYAIFLFMAISGLYLWRKSLNNETRISTW